MEPDISILRKTGHFYFALTAAEILKVRNSNASTEKEIMVYMDFQDHKGSHGFRFLDHHDISAAGKQAESFQKPERNLRIDFVFKVKAG